MKKGFFTFLFFAVFCVSSVAGAVDFSGIYLIKTAKNTITLTVTQKKNGDLTGLIASTTGVKFPLSGKAEEDVAVGTCRVKSSVVPFEAHFEGEYLLFSLLNKGKGPARVIKFPAHARKEPSPNTRPDRQHSLSKGNGNGQLQLGTSSLKRLTGPWICRTANGTLNLNFLSKNQLTFNGDPARYTATQDRLTVQADGQTIVYPYYFHKKGLVITFPNGVKALFVKTTGQPSSPGGKVFSPLVGKWKDIRSSGHTIIALLANGQYSYYSDFAAGSSASGQTNWGYGNANEARGTWAAKGTPRAGTIYYRSQDGSSGTLSYKIHVENGRTYWSEYYFDGILYVKQ